MNGNANYLDTTQLFGFPLSDYGFGSETTGLEYSILSNMLQSPGELPANSDAQSTTNTAETSPLVSQASTNTANISSQTGGTDQAAMAIDSSIWPEPKPMDTPSSLTSTSSPFAVPQGSPSAGSPQQQKPTHYAMTKRDSVSSSGGGRRKGGSGNTPEAVYASVKRPFNYAEGFHYLIQYVRDKMPREDLMRISRALALFRPSFIALIMNLTEEDLVFMEKCLQRTLLEYEKLISFSGTPTVVWRRTGEICLVGKEFSLLTNWSKDALLGKKKYIYELMDSQSAVEYWEKFSMHAFDNTESCAFTTCILLSPTNRPVPCTFCFSIKRDIFDLPSVIVGNFLPILS